MEDRVDSDAAAEGRSTTDATDGPGATEEPSREAEGREAPAPPQTARVEFPAHVEQWVTRIATVAGAITGFIVVVHVLGGVVMWLRFRTADLPADQAVAIMSREQMLTVGLRLIVLPALATTLLAVVLVYAQRHRLEHPRGQESERHSDRWWSGHSTLWASGGVAVLLVALVSVVVTGLSWLALLAVLASTTLVVAWVYARRGKRGRGPETPRAEERRWRRHAALLVSVGLAVLLVALVPASGAGFTWLALFVVVLYWARGFGIRPRPAGETASMWRLAAVAVLAAAFISLGRQVDQPVQLLRASLEVEGQRNPIEGVFVNADENTVHIGDPSEHRITTFRRQDVERMSLGPPLERAPSASLLSRALSELSLVERRWAVTPPLVWCNGDSYWFVRPDKFCETQPAVLIQDRALDIRWIPVRIRCPKAAGQDGCRGYMRLRSERVFGPDALGRLAQPRRVAIPADSAPAVAFDVLPNRTREFCITTTPEERALLRDGRPEGSDQPQRPVPMQLTLTGDPESASVLTEARYRVHVARKGTDPSLVPQSGCSAEERERLEDRPPGTAGPHVPARITGVDDGDTIVAASSEGRWRVRLLGINAPETDKPRMDACGELEAKDALVDLLFPEAVDTDNDGVADQVRGRGRLAIFRADPRAEDRDGGRPSRYVTVVGESRMLQEWQLRAGWALVPAGEPFARRRAFQRAASRARIGGRGLHRSCNGRVDKLEREP